MNGISLVKCAVIPKGNPNKKKRKKYPRGIIFVFPFTESSPRGDREERRELNLYSGGHD